MRVTHGTPDVTTSVSGIRRTAGDTVGLTHNPTTESKPLPVSSPDVATVDVAVAGDNTVREDFNYAVAVCTEDVVTVLGLQVSLG